MARRYVRDAKGRFASKGYSGQTGGRGARLKSGKGNIREVNGQKRGERHVLRSAETRAASRRSFDAAVQSGNVTLPKSLGGQGMPRNSFPAQAAARKKAQAQAERDVALRKSGLPQSGGAMRVKGGIKRDSQAGEKLKQLQQKNTAANKVSASPRQLTKDQQIARDVMTDKRFRSDRQRRAEMIKRGVKPDSDFVALTADVRAKQGVGTTGKIKPASKSKSVDSLNAARQKANSDLDQKRAAYFGTKYGTPEQKKARADLMAAEKKSNAATNAWRDAKAGIKSDTPKGSYAATRIEQAKGRVTQFTTAKKSVDAEIRQVRQQIKDARSNAMTFGDVPALKLKLLSLKGKSQEYKATIDRAKRQAKGE